LVSNIKGGTYILLLFVLTANGYLPGGSYRHTLRVLEIWMMRIFVPKRDEVTRECRKLHNEEFHNLIKSRRMR
jgi:hypothetical protein